MSIGSMPAYLDSAKGLSRLLPVVVLWVFVLGTATGGCVLNEPELHDEAGQLVRRFLAEASGESADRGWSLLLPITRETTFGNDFGKYLEEVETANWGAFAWEIAEIERDDAYIYEVWIEATGELPSVVAKLATAENTDVGPFFSVRFGPAFGGDGIWMVGG